MKKLLVLFALQAIVILSGCGNAKNENAEIKEASVETQQPMGPVGVDLSANGMNLVITVPDSIKSKMVFSKVSDFQLNGEIEEYGFAIFSNEITEGDDMAAVMKAQMDDLKKDIREDENNKFKRYIVEEPNLIFWESDDHGSEFHFCLMVPAEKNTWYRIEENGAIGSEADQKVILDYVKTIKPKAVTPAS